MSVRFRAPKYPKKTLIAAVVAFFFLLFSNFLFQIQTARLYRSVTEKTKTLELLRHEIKQRHILMELAVRMSAYSGYVTWESTYFRHTQAIHAAISTAQSALPEFPNPASAEEGARLRSMNEKIFELVRNDEKKAAQRLVESVHRARLVLQQEQLIEQGDEIISQYIGQQSAAIQRRSQISDLLKAGIAAFLFILTLSAFKLFGAWARKMREANAVLDELIQEKVRELDHERVRMVESSKMAALGQMASGVAHEINNPLATIQARSEQLREMAEEGALDKTMLAEITASIEKTTERIAAIVRGLRSFARDGKNDPLQSAPIQTILEETLNLCKEKFQNNNIALEVSAPPTPLSIDCRPSQIAQVILNLVGNAFDAIQNNPEKWVRITVTEHSDHTEIAVTDSGTGIPQKIQEKLMQPFFTTKEVGKGTGLGLSISQSIIQSHHGQLAIDNRSPNTRFVITLPKTRREPAAA